MFRSRRGPALVAALSMAVLTFAGTAQAQSTSVQVGLRSSTLGVGPELTIARNATVALRVAYQWLEFTRSFDSDDATYDVTPSLSGLNAFVDVHPFKGRFKVTGGLAAHSAELQVAGVPTVGTITVNDVEYPVTDAGTITGTVKMPGVSPYVGIGIGPKLTGTQRVTVAFDVGVLRQSDPTTTLTANGPLATANNVAGATFRENLASEQAKLSSDISDITQWYPVVGLTIRVRFR